MSNRDKIRFALTYPAEIKQAMINYIHDPNSEGSSGGHSGISDPTCIEAIRRVEITGVRVYYGNGKSRYVKEPKKWLMVEEATKKWYAGTIQEEMMKRYFKDEPDQRKDICEALGIGTSYYSAMLKDIYVFASGYAAGLGIIKFF